MPSYVEQIGRYIRTVIDFWRLRPKRFMAAINDNPTRYLPPLQFLAFTVVIGFFVYSATFFLALLIAPETSAQIIQIGSISLEGTARVFAIYVMALIIFILFVETILFRIISNIWPIKGGASFSAIFEFQCYMLATIVPLILLDLLLSPLIALEWVVGLKLSLGLLIGILSLLFWQVPGIAIISGVTTGRLWGGVLFWNISLGIGLGIIGGIIAALFM